MKKIILILCVIALVSCHKTGSEPKIIFPKYVSTEADFKDNLKDFDSIQAVYQFTNERNLLVQKSNNNLNVIAFTSDDSMMKPGDKEPIFTNILEYLKANIVNLDEYDNVNMTLQKEGTQIEFVKSKSEIFTVE